MKLRGWLLGLGIVGSALVASYVATRQKSAPPSFAIAAEPVADRTPEAKPLEPSAQGAFALPNDTRPTKPTRRTPAAPQLPIDYVEPWTGQDLEPAIVAARPAQRRHMDRVDPWNPNVVYEPNSVPRELSEDDPWDTAVSRRGGKALPKAKVALEEASPWDARL